MVRFAQIEPESPTYRGGSGEPLVLIHGGGGTPRLWRTTIPLLKPHHEVLAVTLAGHFGGPEVRQGAGTLDAGTYISETTDGEVILAPTFGTEFSGDTPPPGMSGAQWFPPNGTASLAASS